jgi:hypothetical protein
MTKKKPFLIHQFLRLCYLLFILAGIVCALVSGLIEYQVFLGLYQKHVNRNNEITGNLQFAGMPNNTRQSTQLADANPIEYRQQWWEEKFKFLSIPFLIVFALEMTKVFLVFLDKQYRSTDNKRYIEDRAFFIFLRRILVGISAFCTLLFSFYNLYNPEYENQVNKTANELNANYDKRQTNIQDAYDKRRIQINSEYEQQKEKQFEAEQKDVDYWAKLMDEERLNFGENKVWEGRTYRSYEKKWKERKEKQRQHQDELESKRLEEIHALEQSYNQERNILMAGLDNEVMVIKERLKSDSSSHNKIISAALQVINMKPDYPQWQYISCIGLISILLTLALESIIIGAFTMLAIKHGDLFEASIDRKIAEEEYREAVESIDEIHNIDRESFMNKVLRQKERVLRTLQKLRHSF